MKDETTSPILFEQKQKFTPWVEKYRPSKDDEFSHQTEVVSTLRQSVLTGKVPHLMF
jgi:DNA polymerase III gamma/tau subunit